MADCHCEHVAQHDRWLKGENGDLGDHKKLQHLWEKDLRMELVERFAQPAAIALATALIMRAVG